MLVEVVAPSKVLLHTAADTVAVAVNTEAYRKRVRTIGNASHRLPLELNLNCRVCVRLKALVHIVRGLITKT